MIASRNGDQAIDNVDRYELALRADDETTWQRRVKVGLVIFSLAFCALVFHAGWNEIVALEKCALKGISSCAAVAAKFSHAP